MEYDENVWAWLVEYASYLTNRLEFGKDGGTEYARN